MGKSQGPGGSFGKTIQNKIPPSGKQTKVKVGFGGGIAFSGGTKKERKEKTKGENNGSITGSAKDLKKARGGTGLKSKGKLDQAKGTKEKKKKTDPKGQSWQKCRPGPIRKGGKTKKKKKQASSGDLGSGCGRPKSSDEEQKAWGQDTGEKCKQGWGRG